MLAFCEKKAGNQAAALQLMNTCIDKFPKYKEGYICKAQHLAQTQRYKAAIEVY